MNTKQCTKCAKTKSIDDFRQRKYKSGKSYQLNICKECERKESRDRNRRTFGYNPKGTPRQTYKIIDNNPHIKCKICSKFKSLNSFTVDKRSKSFERTSICKLCRKKLRKEKYESIVDKKDMIHRIFLSSKHRATIKNIEFIITEKDIFTKKMSLFRDNLRV